VLVFRKRLLPYSETFIADQGRFLPTWQASFAGLYRQDSGLQLLGDAERLILQDMVPSSFWARFALRSGLRVDNAWSNALETCSPRLVHAHFVNDGLDALRLQRNLQCPVVTTLHGHDITKPQPRPWQGRGSRSLFAGCDRIIAVSNFIAGHALRKGCPENKLVQHYIGIDLEKFSMAKNETAEPSVLFVGRLADKKGVTYLLDALARLKNTVPGVYLTVVGSGGLLPRLHQQAEEQELDVRFAGRKTPAEVRQLLSTHWVFAAPSITADNGDAEGLGMVFLEAQAMHTPVLSFRSGGVVEAVADGETGLLCAEKDVPALADNLQTLLNSKQLRATMGAAGRSRVERNFDIRQQCGKLEAIYNSVVSGKG
jgi:glycosyltransferase involved in cell wall biosynthesis